jgi:hypothetical protein
MRETTIIQPADNIPSSHFSILDYSFSPLNAGCDGAARHPCQHEGSVKSGAAFEVARNQRRVERG